MPRIRGRRNTMGTTTNAFFPRTRLNVDDVATIVRIFESTAASMTLEHGLDDGHMTELELGHLETEHPARLRQVTISASRQVNMLPAEALDLRITPNLIVLSHRLEGDPHDQAMRLAFERTEKLLEAMPSAWWRPEWMVRALGWALSLALVAVIAAYVAQGGSALLAVVLLGLVVASFQSALQTINRLHNRLRLWAPGWLDQKSRRELSAERADRKANVRAAVVGALLGAALTVLAGWIKSRS